MKDNTDILNSHRLVVSTSLVADVVADIYTGCSVDDPVVVGEAVVGRARARGRTSRHMNARRYDSRCIPRHWPSVSKDADPPMAHCMNHA